MDTKLSHPTSDPALPSFVHPVLADLQTDLQRAYDAYHYLRGSKSQPEGDGSGGGSVGVVGVE